VIPCVETDFREMYEVFFKLKERPFAAAPVTKRYFPAANIEHARQSLRRAIDRAEGTGLIVGPSGTGKSLLLQVLADEFRDRLRPVLLTSGRLSTARALLQAILFELNLPYRHMDESELRLSLVDHLAPSKLGCEGLLLLIDEAHSMSWRLLEEVRMITNLVRDGQPRVRVVLAGSPKLEERFASPRLDSFSQRLAARCYLESLSRDETAAYVRGQIQAVGGVPTRLLADDALAAVHRATDGIPRLINQVCDHALLLASLGGLRTLGAAAIEEAWADLQQLPAPWNASETPKSVGTRVIEFGGLDDAGDDLPEAIPFPVTTGAASHGKSSVVEFGEPIADPEHQLDRLEAHLNELEEDFQPAGAIRPEVELIFRGGNNPFGEEFTEEEVVLDRYASLEADVFGHRPVVTCREGRELGELLAPHTRQVAEATVPIREEVAATATKSSATATTTAVVEPIRRAAADEDEDADLIVLEDDVHTATKPVPPPLVRKQEYRQLFAKLRRG
jgi:type II secretory pathway predicted ATPase ExeA